MKEKDVKKIGHRMSKKKADKWVKRYQKSQKNNPDPTYGWLYGCDIICDLLEEEGADGIWFFKALNGKGEERLVMYPADKDGNILSKAKMRSLGAKANNDDDDDDGAANDSETCPPTCPGGS